MNKTKINILFLIAKNRMNTSGKCAIKCRITYNKQRHEFSTGLFINPKNWSSAKQQAFPLNTENTQINTQLSLIKQEINQAFLFLQVGERTFDVEDIFRQYKGEPSSKQIGIVEFYSNYMERLRKVVIYADIVKIGNDAFKDAVKFDRFVIRTTKLKKAGKNIFKNVSKKMIIEVPKKSLSSYRKLFRNKGVKVKEIRVIKK